jgi:hypothetical protein
MRGAATCRSPERICRETAPAGPADCWRAAFPYHPMSARRPASVIINQTTAICRLPARMVPGCLVARPSRTRAASNSALKPWASMIASVQPCGPPASSRSARYWSLLMRAHALIVTVRSRDFRAAAGIGATRCRHNDYPNSAPDLLPRSARGRPQPNGKGKTGAPGKGRFPGEVWGEPLGSIPDIGQLPNPAAALWKTGH